jgi:hypothetical protein
LVQPAAKAGHEGERSKGDAYGLFLGEEYFLGKSLAAGTRQVF